MGGYSSQASEALAYIRSHDPGSQYDAVVLGYGSAGDYVRAGGRVISVGGFTGQMGNLTVDELKQLISDGSVRYVVISGGGQGGPGGMQGSSESASQQISSWVSENLTAVDGQTGLYVAK